MPPLGGRLIAHYLLYIQGGNGSADDWRTAPARGPEGHPGPGELSCPRLRGPRGGPKEAGRAADDGHRPRERPRSLEAHPPRTSRKTPTRAPREADRRGPDMDLLRPHGPREENPPPGARHDRRVPLPVDVPSGGGDLRARVGADVGDARGPGDRPDGVP